MYAYELQPGQTYTVDKQSTIDYGVLRAAVVGGNPSVNIHTGLGFYPGPLVEVTLVDDPGDERREPCRKCGTMQPVSVLACTVERYYDWDDPDTDSQGSILLTRYVWECRDTHRCREVRRVTVAAWHDDAINDDATQYSRGIGQGWAVQP